MRIVAISLIVLGVVLSIPYAHGQNNSRPTIANEEDFHRAMKELSNWGRWGDGRRAKRRGQSDHARETKAGAGPGNARFAHFHWHNDVAQEIAADAPNILVRTLGDVAETGTTDRYQYGRARIMAWFTAIWMPWTVTYR